MQMCVLASGSSGNCTVVRVGGRTFLIDAGIGPRAAGKRLDGTGAAVEHVSAILLTHLDSDHFKPTWFTAIRKHSIAVHMHRRHVHDFYRCNEDEARWLHKAGLLSVFDGQPFALELSDGSAATVRTVRCEHDEEGTVSYRIDSPHGRLAFATDLGRVTDRLIEAMTDVDLLAIESNYDPPMQLASSRPVYLKRRIMGGRGHLSNEQAYEAVCQAIGRSRTPPRHVVLLHLSRQCNRPTVARKLFGSHPHLADGLCITSQYERTTWLRATPRAERLVGEQLVMWS